MELHYMQAGMVGAPNPMCARKFCNAVYTAGILGIFFDMNTDKINGPIIPETKQENK
jgi:hypothetical protein